MLADAYMPHEPSYYYGGSSSYDVKYFIIALCFMTFLIDWAAVTFSAQCVWYIPIISASVLQYELRNSIQGEKAKR